MRKIIFLLFIGLSLSLMAKEIDLNYKGTIMPFDIKIEKLIVGDECSYVIFSIKQKKKFSYQITLDGCNIVNCKGDAFPGTLSVDEEIDENQKINVSDKMALEVVLKFPGAVLDDCQEFDITLGYIQNRKKTPLTFKNVKLGKN